MEDEYAMETSTQETAGPFIRRFMGRVGTEFNGLNLYRRRADQHSDAERYCYGQRRSGRAQCRNHCFEQSNGFETAGYHYNEGLFTLALLPPGIYSLQAQREGFSVAEIQDIELPVAGQVSQDIVLQVSGVRETVSVSAAPPLLQTDTSALAEIVNNTQVDLLPINGRDFRRLTTLLPGAAPRSQRGSLGSFTVNGQREKANIFLIDGVDNNDSFRNQPSFNQGGVTGAPATLLPMDAVDEFSLQTQGAAE